MGLTHYWYRVPRARPAAMALAATDIERILTSINIPLAGSDGTGDPVISASGIHFNGPRPHCGEDFCFDRDDMAAGEHIWGWGKRKKKRENLGGVRHGIFSFCKTLDQPYDLAVQISLVVLHHHLNQPDKPPKLVVASDRNLDDWTSAIEQVRRSLQVEPFFKLKNS